MAKVSISIAKKVPIEGIPYSSTSIGASIELEVDTETTEELREIQDTLLAELRAFVEENLPNPSPQMNDGAAWGL